MKSFRNELEDLNNPVVEKDIIDLEKKISLFRDGKVDEEKFRSLRLARGIYGQRQPGVQMIRIKIPHGRISVKQLNRICDVSDEYATGNLHLTTRQDIQIHYVSLDRTPELWAELEKDNVTIREACGNTVRNITASDYAGIDPNEPFDVSPYAHAFFKYFLRNPICQEMGRKFKISFSSSEYDTALSFMHDLGFIPKNKIVDGKEVKGFKVMVGGGLGAQAIHAETGSEFLEVDKLIPFSEAVIRVFDRHGERASRGKARLKFLIKNLGMDAFMELVKEEMNGLPHQTYAIDESVYVKVGPAPESEIPQVNVEGNKKYQDWLKTNIYKQKQDGFYAVNVKISLGNLSTEKSRKFAEVVKKWAADDIRISIKQGFVVKFVREAALPVVFTELDEIGLAEPGYGSITDITSCPGTDTCNLGISSSYGSATALEKVLKEEYYDLIFDSKINIKISGCMNACGQHNIANIGFHGSSLKHNKMVVPAMMLLLGGGIELNGIGSMADKVIKLPSKRIPDALRKLLDDFEANANEGEYFNDYYKRLGKDYFYETLKPLANLDTLQDSDYYDWGGETKYKTEIGVGECAGVVIDLVSTLFFEAEEKYNWAKEAFEEGDIADAAYHAYNSFLQGAKALLISKDVKCNTQIGIINDFDERFIKTGEISLNASSFNDLVLKVKETQPTKEFTEAFIKEAGDFLNAVKQYREKELTVEA